MVKKIKPPEQINGTFSAIPHVVLDSSAYMGASHPARSLLLELARQINGRNNGHLQLTSSWLRKRGWRSVDVIDRAKKELINRGLVVRTRAGGLNSGPDQWAVTWLHISNYVGLDLRAPEFRRSAWVDFKEPEKQNKRSVTRHSTTLPDGTTADVDVPPDGAKLTFANVVAVPADGNNVSTNVPKSRTSTKRIVGKRGKSGIALRFPPSQ
jgi:hypothetical protein